MKLSHSYEIPSGEITLNLNARWQEDGRGLRGLKFDLVSMEWEGMETTREDLQEDADFYITAHQDELQRAYYLALASEARGDKETLNGWT